MNFQITLNQTLSVFLYDTKMQKLFILVWTFYTSLLNPFQEAVSYQIVAHLITFRIFVPLLSHVFFFFECFVKLWITIYRVSLKILFGSMHFCPSDIPFFFKSKWQTSPQWPLLAYIQNNARVKLFFPTHLHLDAASYCTEADSNMLNCNLHSDIPLGAWIAKHNALQFSGF